MEKLRTINANTTNIPEWLDSESWDFQFDVLKSKIEKSKFKKMGKAASPITGEYKGNTNYEYYIQYINSVLNRIRNGYVDYCYHVYQISELLRFEPDMRAVLVREPDISYFKVWL